MTVAHAVAQRSIDRDQFDVPITVKIAIGPFETHSARLWVKHAIVLRRATRTYRKGGPRHRLGR